MATYCKRELCPIQSEEGFSGLCSTSNIGGLEELYKEFSIQELRELDSEGRCVITDHGTIHSILHTSYPVLHQI